MRDRRDDRVTGSGGPDTGRQIGGIVSCAVVGGDRSRAGHKRSLGDGFGGSVRRVVGGLMAWSRGGVIWSCGRVVVG